VLRTPLQVLAPKPPNRVVAANLTITAALVSLGLPAEVANTAAVLICAGRTICFVSSSRSRVAVLLPLPFLVYFVP
jgi:hypothetical protein